jgi:hypothetical protein
MDKFKELMKQCKCGIFLKVNEHRDYYQSTKECIEEINSSEAGEIDEETAKDLIEKDLIITLQFYPDTPVGFYIIYGTDIDKILDEALKTLKNERNK